MPARQTRKTCSALAEVSPGTDRICITLLATLIVNTVMATSTGGGAGIFGHTDPILAVLTYVRIACVDAGQSRRLVGLIPNTQHTGYM